MYLFQPKTRLKQNLNVKNKKLTFDELVQKRMFLLMILSIVFFGYFGGIQTVGYNETVGWALDIKSWLFFAKNYFLPIYVIGYGVIAILKWLTHKNISKIHLILVILTFIVDDIFTLDINLIIILNLISMIFFIANIVWVIRNKNKTVYKTNTH